IEVAPVPTHLAFETGASDMPAGSTLPEIRVALRDANGHVVTGAEAAVSLSLVGGTPEAELIGTTEKQARQGTVSFGGLRITKVGRFRLEATSQGFSPVQSDEFLVRHLEAEWLVFGELPAKLEAFAGFSAVVEVRDHFGNPVPDWARDVTLSLADDLQPGGLMGKRTVAVQEGVATFENVFVTRAGRDLALSATGPGIPSFRSAGFDVRITFAQVSAGESHTCGVTAAGVVLCWGSDAGERLGNGDLGDASVPVPVESGERFVSVSTGSAHSCGITRKGKAYCWGDNGSDGRLGNGSHSGTYGTPTAVVGDHSFRQISVGEDFSCGLTIEGEAFCWGGNVGGTLGNGGASNSAVPVQVFGGHVFVSLSAGGRHACGLTADGHAWCWGDGWMGGGGGSSTKPTHVDGRVFRAISCGADATCALDAEGDAYCWGNNDWGQLGNGSFDPVSLPVRVATSKAFASIVAGAYRACGLTADGEAHCWGNNTNGELGDGGRGFRETPVRSAPGLALADISLGRQHTCGVTRENETWCWGRGASGELGGGGSVELSIVPVLVRGTER
ncbi:MAG TPA: hypothetical protein VGD74_12545, partial [Vulgatibacter sp.]